MAKSHSGKTPLSREYLVGAAVYARHKGEVYLALVHDVFGHWTLAKGKIEHGETKHAALHREMQEELGLPIVIKQKLGTNSYLMHHPKKGRIKKVVDYFLAEAPYQKLVLEKSGGLDGVRWIRLDKLETVNLYEDVRQIVSTATDSL